MNNPLSKYSSQIFGEYPKQFNKLLNIILTEKEIEQDADVVIFLYRPWVYSQEDEDEGKANIIIAKQRNGPTGNIQATFISKYARFENLAFSEDPF